MAPDDVTNLVNRIHDRPTQLVLEFTGAGAVALAWLHSVGGSSRTVLEASDRYSPGALIDLIGYTPDRYTGLETSRAMAGKALARARELAAAGTPVIGIGASATIATDRLKKGEHRAAVVLAGALGLQGFELTLEKGSRVRLAEEELVSRLILNAIARGKGLLKSVEPGLLDSEGLTETFEPAAELEKFIQGETGSVMQLPDLSLAEPPTGKLLILSGSFNPLHHGHTGLAQAAGSYLNQPVHFELPLVNADKPEVALAEVQPRSSQFAGLGPVLLTRAPLFVDKARLFPGSTFIIGVDTATRLLDERFYGSADSRQAAFAELDELGARFLVAGRKKPDGFAVLTDLGIPGPLKHLFSELPEDEFRVDISSTELRQQRAGVR